MFDCLKKLIDKFFNGHCHRRCGSIWFTHGKHEVFVNTHFRPHEVFISFDEAEDCTPVCHGNINKVGIRKQCNGFVVYAEVFTDTLEVKFLVR